MENSVSSTASANPDSLSKCELLILHTAEAQEWATYLQQILRSSQKLRTNAILLHAVDPSEELHASDFESFRSCGCVVLLLSSVFLNALHDPELQGALQRLLQPPHRVVALLCGVSEDEMSTLEVKDWTSWRKIYAEDDPAVYISTVLESISGGRVEAEDEAAVDSHIAAASLPETPTADEREEVAPEERKAAVLKDEEAEIHSAEEEKTSPTQLTCLTVQPRRVLCGAQETLYIVLTHKLNVHSVPEVEFSSAEAAQRVAASVENEYTISVTAPDMPVGLVSLTMHTSRSSISLQPVIFYTNMEEVSRCLENATDPVNFICQAFNLTSNATEYLDDMLTESLKSRMPATSLQLFGISQIEEDNLSSCQRTEELPTLLHFAAKYGLKKLTRLLLQCPGALQAYSVMNKHGDYPNTLAGKNGFNDLRHFMDEFVKTADMLKCHFEENMNTEDGREVYELMFPTSEDIMMKYSTGSEDIYESMRDIDPEYAENLYEMMDAVDKNPDAVLREFFQVKLHDLEVEDEEKTPQSEKEEKNEQHDWDQVDQEEEEQEEEEEEEEEEKEEEEEEEDPYSVCPEDIYHIVDSDSTYNSAILNRPPAPIPRPQQPPPPEESAPYISRVFSETGSSHSSTDKGCPAARPVVEAPTSTYDPFAGMKTPGQRQLVSLQERVKVEEITVDEAVQEFKAWKFDHERRSNSLRYQQENLKKLRSSITRRHKERGKAGKELGYEISAPLQRNMCWGSNVMLDCAIYEGAPRKVAAPPPTTPHIQRGNWKTGSTSSTSSTESNRLSTHSALSNSSGTEPDFEDTAEILPPPPRPPRPSDAATLNSPPRIPPRIPERVPEIVHERYSSCPTRPPPQRPPPVPRRLR